MSEMETIGFDMFDATVDIALTQTMTLDLVAAGIVEPAKVGEFTPMEVRKAHRDARACGTAGVRSFEQLTQDLNAQVKCALDRRSKRRMKAIAEVSKEMPQPQGEAG
jgi:hypothetical protein